MKEWITAPGDERIAAGLAAESGIPRAMAAVLAARGHTSAEAVDAWLNPRLSALSDPCTLPSMARAVDRLVQALERSETVLVYGDYDVDGLTSTVLMVEVLRALGATVVPFLPHRVDDGYGLGVEPVERCLAEHRPGCILTVDCGTGSVEAVEAARAGGVDVVVTDHHEPGDRVASAYAVVNPKLNTTDDSLHGLAGVGVAFKLAHALLKRLRAAGHPAAQRLDLKLYLDLVAIGTIADMVPLTGENRALACYGLAQLNRTERCGLLALKEVSGITGPVDGYQVGFMLGPRLNAAGRLGTACAALELLLTRDPSEATRLAAALNTANRERQQTEARMVEEAVAQVDAWFDPARHHGVLAFQRDWHAGVIGIVASRLARRYSRPAVVVAVDGDGVGRGSCRSIAPFNMVEGLGDCADLLDRYGGHPMAAGLQVAAERVELLRERFDAAVRARVDLAALRPVLPIDAWIGLREADWPLVECLERMGPFGQGNARPVWAARGVQLCGPPRVVGKNHLKMTVIEGNARLDAIAFGMGNRTVPDGPMDVAFHLNRNTFRGQDILQLVVQDFRPADGTARSGSIHD